MDISIVARACVCDGEATRQSLLFSLTRLRHLKYGILNASYIHYLSPVREREASPGHLDGGMSDFLPPLCHIAIRACVLEPDSAIMIHMRPQTCTADSRNILSLSRPRRLFLVVIPRLMRRRATLILPPNIFIMGASE